MPDVNDSRIWIFWMGDIQDIEDVEELEDEIGAEGWEGWSDISTAVEHLSAAFEKEVCLVCDRKFMMRTGRRGDLKAIWDKVFIWRVGEVGRFEEVRKYDLLWEDSEEEDEVGQAEGENPGPERKEGPVKQRNE